MAAIFDAIVPKEVLDNMTLRQYRNSLQSRHAEEGEDGVVAGFAHIDGPTESAASPPTCSKTCRTCSQHFRPKQWQGEWEWLEYDHVWSDEEAANDIEETLSSAKDYLEKVAQKLKDYGNAIAKRWLKKSPSKRAALLRAASPDLRDERWAAAEMVYKQKALKANDWNLYHESWLLPHLDIESLSNEPWKFLALLHFRTQHGLAEWAMFDTQQLRMPFLEGAVEVSYNPHCVIMHGERYGELVTWEADAAHRWDIVGFPRAQVTFEAQDRLADLLASVVDSLLETEATVGNDKWLSLPFGPPPTTDLEGLLEMLQARLHAAEDAVRALQTQPKHVRLLLEWAKSSSWFKSKTSATQEEYLLRLALGPNNRLDHFDAAVFAAREALFAYVRHSEHIMQGRFLPKKYQQAMQNLKHALEEVRDVITYDLGDLAAYHAAFVRHYCCCHVETPHLGEEVETIYKSDKLFWCIHQLSQAGEVYETDALLSYAGDLLRDRTHRSKIEDSLRTLLDDVAAVDAALRTLRYHQPQVNCLSDADYDKRLFDRKDLGEWRCRCRANAGLLRKSPEWMCEPLEKLLSIPAAVKHLDLSAADAEARSRGRAALDDFWIRVYAAKDIDLEIAGMPERTRALFLDVLGVRKAGQTKAPRNSVENASAAMKAKPIAQQPHAAPDLHRQVPTPIAIQSVWGHESTHRVEIHTPKEKLKTRPSLPPTTTPSVVSPKSISSDSTPVSTQAQIPVSATSLRLFHRMYNPTERTKGTACGAWEDFAAAMTDAGCIVKQAGGSGVSFMLAGWGSGAINIHKPHPDAIINPIVLGSIGRKLSDRFGWERETFVLRGRLLAQARNERWIAKMSEQGGI